MPTPTADPATDGVTHINIYSKGKTELGRLLSNFARTPFVHPEDGAFASVEGYWYWLSVHDDRLRTLDGSTAKNLGRELGGNDYPDDDPEFRRKVTLAIHAKLKQHPHIVALMRKNTLPYLHYYIFGSKIEEPTKGLWVLDVIHDFLLPRPTA